MNLKLIQEPISGTIEISENSQYNKIDADSVSVGANITARLYGNVKDIILNEGARLYIHGIISGNVINNGGEIHIFNRDGTHN